MPTPDAVLYHSWPHPDGVRVEYLSDRADELLEVTADELGHLFSTGTLPLWGVDEAEFYHLAAESLANHSSWRAEFGWVGPKTGTRRWLRASDFPRRAPDGTAYFVGVISDLTAARDAEAGRRYESLGVLAGGIAHDFNNLLTVILGNAEVGRALLPAGSPVADALREVEAAGRRAADLCGQLTAYAGVGRLAVGPVDVGEGLRGIEPALHADAAPARLVLDVPPGLPAAHAEPFQVRQAVRNLVTNAGQVSPPGAVVRVAVAAVRITPGESDTFTPRVPAGDYLSVRVTDAGPGLPAEVRAAALDPFAGPRAVGHGLGLAAVFGIARGHRGGVRFTPAPGHGTVAELLLPLVAHFSPLPLFPTDSPAPLSRPNRTGTVLVCDDEPEVRELIAGVLEDDGWAVVRTGHAAEALATDLTGVAVAVLDVMLPGASGHDLLRDLRRVRPGLPAVVVSGYSERELPPDLPASGPTAVLPKPFKLPQLLAVVAGVLGPPTA